MKKLTNKKQAVKLIQKLIMSITGNNSIKVENFQKPGCVQIFNTSKPETKIIAELNYNYVNTPCKTLLSYSQNFFIDEKGIAYDGDTPIGTVFIKPFVNNSTRKNRDYSSEGKYDVLYCDGSPLDLNKIVDKLRML